VNTANWTSCWVVRLASVRNSAWATVYDLPADGRFAADFTQTCESTTAPPLTGAIRYNSTVPPPELILPSISIAQPLNSHGCFEATSASGIEVTATGSATGASSLDLAWSTSTGLTGSGTQFSVSMNLNQYLTLSLTATDPLRVPQKRSPNGSARPILLRPKWLFVRQNRVLPIARCRRWICW
jgi:hypothetical protein